MLSEPDKEVRAEGQTGAGGEEEGGARAGCAE